MSDAAPGEHGIDPTAIERQLAALWQPGDEEGARSAPALRACMSNLLIYCERSAEAETIQTEIEPIVQQHPSRVLLLVAESASGEPALRASVSATCYLGEGGRRVCAEAVTLHAGDTPGRRLPAAARPLIIGELPTSLWWTGSSPAVLAGDLFRELVSMGEQLIVDSTEWPEASLGLAALARWASGTGGVGLSDLSWTRTHPWRSALAQALDAKAIPGALATIRKVRLEHGSGGGPQARLLSGWLASRLGWDLVSVRRGDGRVEARYSRRPGDITLEIVRRDDASGLTGVSVDWEAGDAPRQISLRRAGPERLSVARGESEPFHARPLPQRPRAWLVARELADLGRDRVFRAALQETRQLIEGDVA